MPSTLFRCLPPAQPLDEAPKQPNQNHSVGQIRPSTMPEEETALLRDGSRGDGSSYRTGDGNPWQLRILLGFCYAALVVYTFNVFAGPLWIHLLANPTDWCSLPHNTTYFNATDFAKATDQTTFPSPITAAQLQFLNPDYPTDPCLYLRLPRLLGMTLMECNFCRRLLTSVILGGLIGYERRSADRPAGIRTMALVSLGACSFTISSISGFATSTMIWDSSRVAAGVVSGVGFLGGALIWKGKVQDRHQVHGLTTAASLWFSAAIGIGAGGALYFVSIYTVSPSISLFPCTASRSVSSKSHNGCVVHGGFVSVRCSYPNNSNASFWFVSVLLVGTLDRP